jgi:hypothetical protein
LINLDRVAYEIKTVGLYDLVLQDVQRDIGKNRVSEDEIKEALKTNSQILEDYMQTNVEYNLSNIHIKDIPIDNLKDNNRQIAQDINANLKELKKLEKYTLDFEQSATLVIIFSIEFFVLFSVQYFIILLDLKEWQWWIYSLFASTVLYAWLYARKESKLFDKNNAIFQEKYKYTLELLNTLEADGIIDKKNLMISESDEHI